MARKPVSLRDVAAVAGVSASTASRVLNGQGRVSDATRQRIVEAAERLDFQPNALARSLVSGRSHTIGVLAVNAPGAFVMPVLTGATTRLGEHDLSALIYDSHLDRDLLAATVRKLRARRIDGLLVLGDGSRSGMRSVSEGFAVPVVYAYGVSDDAQDASFLHDGRLAGQIAGEHLLSLGRRRIAHITAWDYDLSARARAEGLSSALDAAGVELVLGHPLHGDWSRQWGVRAAQELLASGAPFDAVFCGNDEIALGVYSVLRDAGLRVPGDVALVGMDNMSGMLGHADTLLTTIDPRLNALGAAAADYLVAAIDGGPYEGGLHSVPCTLVLGESTALDPAA